MYCIIYEGPLIIRVQCNTGPDLALYHRMHMDINITGMLELVKI